MSLEHDAFTTAIWKHPSAKVWTFQTDASAFGWGAICLQTGDTAADVLPEESMTASSAERELVAVLKAVEALDKKASIILLNLQPF